MTPQTDRDILRRLAEQQAEIASLDLLEKTRGCHVEIVLKEISTVRNQPHRLWEWAEIARQVTEAYA